jgi:uncharacterized protein
VVKLLLERGTDPATTTSGGETNLVAASSDGHVEVVRVLLGLPSDKVHTNHRDLSGKTALWVACHNGRGGVVKALLEGGADPTTPNHQGVTPVATARRGMREASSVDEGRRQCRAALKVRLWSS